MFKIQIPPSKVWNDFLKKKKKKNHAFCNDVSAKYL